LSADYLGSAFHIIAYRRHLELSMSYLIHSHLHPLQTDMIMVTLFW